MLGALMPNLAHILLRVLAGIVGALLLYLAFFLYEDEEARIQNRLEQIWKRIDALQSSAMSKEVAFLQGATRTTGAILDRFLGHKLLSAQSISVSMAFSFASLCLFWHLVYVSDDMTGERTVTLFAALLLLFMGSLPAFAAGERSAWRALQRFICTAGYYYGLLVLVIGLTWLLLSTDHLRLNAMVIIYGLIIIVGVFIDILFVVFVRWMLRRLSGVLKLWPIILCVSLIAVVVIFLGYPLVWFLSNQDNAPLSNTGVLLVFAGLVSATSLIDTLCLLLLVAIMLLLLAHRILWPLVKRPIYAANRKQLIKNTKLLGTLGTLLLLYASPKLHWLTKFLPNLK